MITLSPTRRSVLLAASILGLSAGVTGAASARGLGALIVSSSTYATPPGTIVVGQALPNSAGVKAIADATYPTVFSNDSVDANFGITSGITLDATLGLGTNAGGVALGQFAGSLDITALTGISTSFPSKSELALNISSDGTALTFMGYQSPVNALDVSNSNTPGHVDATNTDTQTATYRAVVSLGSGGTKVIPVAAYSGNNGRAAVLIKDIVGSGQDGYLMVGNGGNGSGTPPTSIVSNTGVQLALAGSASPETQVIGTPQGTPGAKNGFQYGFSVTQIGQPADKSGKDDNFRGLTRFGNQIFVSKGSGSNGVNTVYQVLQGFTPSNPAEAAISILPGFPTTLASTMATLPVAQQFYPFGLFFADATTLYVADEGPQSLTAAPNAGLQKWIFNGTKWVLAYTLQKGLSLDTPYTVANYPSGLSPATTGLRNITGSVDGNKVTIFASTATYSSAADPGADPNSVVQIVDKLKATTLPAGESFKTVRAPTSGTVYRGVAYLSCTSVSACLTLLASR